MLTKTVKITRLENNAREEKQDIIVSEVPIQIILNGTELATILASPDQLKELGLGFLFTEGFIDSLSEIEKFEQKQNSLYFTIAADKFSQKEKIQKYITSGCGRGASFAIALKSLKQKKNSRSAKTSISADQISELMKEFQKKSEVFLTTGGVHSAALTSAKEILFFTEDIGRHNAVDRAIGLALTNQVKLTDKFLLTSGRISSEIVRKVAEADIPVLISRSAPTDRALEFAQELQVTTIGFARGQKMNIYTHPERIK
ncbi:MAG: formate dehydrogenase accessory sulfurtransferase FdhD [Pseudomonadota bacterium]